MLPLTQPVQAPILQDKGKGKEWVRPSHPSGTATSLFMGPSTPWKSSTQFLNPPGSQRNPVPGIVPPKEGVILNILHSLGSVNSGIWGEDGLLANSQVTVIEGLSPGQLAIAKPITSIQKNSNQFNLEAILAFKPEDKGVTNHPNHSPNYTLPWDNPALT